MQKKALLALLLAMTLLLSGCALIVKDQAVDDQTVIIRMGDKTVTKKEVKAATNTQLYNTYYMHYMYGLSYDPTSAENIASAQESAIETLEENLVIDDQIEKRGLTLNEEEEAAAMEDAQSDYDSEVEYAANYEITDTSLEGDARTDAAKAELEKAGYTLEYFQNSSRKEALKKKLREDVVKDVAVTDEEIQEEYDRLVEAAKEDYEENAGEYANDANGSTTLYYAPEGVRRVKQILTKFHEDDQTAIDDAHKKVTEANTAVTTANAKITNAQEIIDSEDATEEDKTQAEADKQAAEAELAEANAAVEAAQKEEDAARETAFANLDEEVDAILAQLAGGADWETLMAEKNQDPGMQSGTGAEKGYAVAEGMTSFDAAFVDAAMALEKIGDITGKIRGNSYGYYIIKYIADEPAGPIALETVKESISADLLEDKQDETYSDTLAKWVEDAGFKVDLNALKD